MQKLIIVAHPNSHGFAHRIAKKFAHVSESCGHNVRMIDLYDPTYLQWYLQLSEHNKELPDDKTVWMQEQISRADQLVFVYPVWWYDAPAILKNWFDVNMSSGFAYRYRKNSLIPHQYLRGKTARFFVTAGAPSWLWYTPIGRWIFINMIIGRLGFVGIWTKSFTMFGNMIKYRDKKHRDRFLAKVEKVARK